MRRLVNKKVAVLTILAGFALVGLVYAAWTTNGTGNAYSKAGTAQTLSTVDVSASTTATLYPGVSGDVLVKIDNPNPYAVTVTAVTGNGTITADLFKGSIELKSRESTHSLFFPEIRGLQSRSFNQQLCGPAAQIGGLPWEILAMRDAKLSQA